MPAIVVIIDADDIERRRLRRSFEDSGFKALEASNGVQGLLHVLDSEPGLIILSEEVAPLFADDLLNVLRRLTSEPIIVLGDGDDPDEVAALEKGADYYARRSFGLESVVVRSRSLWSRHHRAQSDALIAVSALKLTRVERRLLRCLAAQGRRAVSTRELLLQVWAGQATRSTVKFHAWRLRRKLDHSGSGLRVEALPGIGYRLVRESNEPPDSETPEGGRGRRRDGGPWQPLWLQAVLHIAG